MQTDHNHVQCTSFCSSVVHTHTRLMKSFHVCMFERFYVPNWLYPVSVNCISFIFHFFISAVAQCQMFSNDFASNKTCPPKQSCCVTMEDTVDVEDLERIIKEGIP